MKEIIAKLKSLHQQNRYFVLFYVAWIILGWYGGLNYLNRSFVNAFFLVYGIVCYVLLKWTLDMVGGNKK